MIDWLSEHTVSVPSGKSGDWEVSQFTVTEKQADFDRLRGMFRGGRHTRAGTYTQLKCAGILVMSDTHDEISDHLWFIGQARGHVLINGLGLGMCLQAAARKDVVTKVTVIEQSADVIALVAPHYVAMFGDKVEIIHDDAFTYKPPKGIHYGAIWHDVWNDLCGDNVDEMTKLKRKYGGKCDWQGCWGEAICRLQKKRDRV